MKKTDNPELSKTTRFLRRKAREFEVPLWKATEKRLKSKHPHCVVNLSRINRYTKKGETVIVPGKVLGAGNLNHKVTVAAFCFSREAKRKIKEVGGECLTFSALINKNPEGTNVRIVG